MQLMAERGLEYGATDGLGWVRGEITRMPAPGLRLPQMGWNGLDFAAGAHPLLEGLVPGDHVYFTHSYALTEGWRKNVSRPPITAARWSPWWRGAIAPAPSFTRRKARKWASRSWAISSGGRRDGRRGR